jgi:hypothetical protein
MKCLFALTDVFLVFVLSLISWDFDVQRISIEFVMLH